MRIQKLALSLTAINMVLLAFLVGQTFKPAQAEEGAKIAQPDTLRARSLEIVDDQGRVRALLTVQPPARVDGRDYPEEVLLRMIDPTSGPIVKLTASKAGSGLLLSDDADGGFLVHARDTGNIVKVFDRAGTAKILRPGDSE